METGLKLKGIFTLRVFDNGKLLEEFTDNNLVVNVGRESLAHLLAGDGVDKQITKIAFGTSGTAQTVDDTTITGAFIKALEVSVSYPEINSVLFNFELETTENNGVTIREFGLMSEDETLFARITREGVAKTNLIRFEGTWKIIFAAI